MVLLDLDHPTKEAFHQICRNIIEALGASRHKELFPLANDYCCFEQAPGLICACPLIYS